MKKNLVMFAVAFFAVVGACFLGAEPVGIAQIIGFACWGVCYALCKIFPNETSAEDLPDDRW